MYIRSVPQGQKVSRYDTLYQVYKSTGKKPNSLIAPELHEDAIFTWNLFVNLPVLTMSEIYSYCCLTGELIQPWQVDALLEMNKLKNKDYSKGR